MEYAAFVKQCVGFKRITAFARDAVVELAMKAKPNPYSRKQPFLRARAGDIYEGTPTRLHGRRVTAMHDAKERRTIAWPWGPRVRRRGYVTPNF